MVALAVACGSKAQTAEKPRDPVKAEPKAPNRPVMTRAEAVALMSTWEAAIADAGKIDLGKLVGDTIPDVPEECAKLQPAAVTMNDVSGDQDYDEERFLPAMVVRVGEESECKRSDGLPAYCFIAPRKGPTGFTLHAELVGDAALTLQDVEFEYHPQHGNPDKVCELLWMSAELTLPCPEDGDEDDEQRFEQSKLVDYFLTIRNGEILGGPTLTMEDSYASEDSDETFQATYDWVSLDPEGVYAVLVYEGERTKTVEPIAGPDSGTEESSEEQVFYIVDEHCMLTDIDQESIRKRDAHRELPPPLESD